MSASPTTTVSSQKRPLEEPSSPSGPTDQPEAKRPALDNKIGQSEDAEPKKPAPAPVEVPIVSSTDIVQPSGGTQQTSAGANGVKDEQGDTVVSDAPTATATQPIETTTSTDRASRSAAPATQQHDESNSMHIRAVISSAEAATVIGKGGENVSLIRRMSGAKCTVSDYQRGAVERILTVSGLVDA